MNQVEKQLLEEVKRYSEINKYLIEQAEPPMPPIPGTPPPPGAGVPPIPGTPPPPATEGGLDEPPVEDSLPAEAPPEEGVPEKPASDDTTEEMDITDLVNMTKNIKQQLDTKTADDSGTIQKMNDVFAKLDDLASKLGEMDNVIAKIDELGAKVEQMKPPTPVEKLEMRSLDSYPFNQKPEDFFNQKQGEMKASGKNEYVLTKDDIQNYAQENIMKSFNPDQDEQDQEYRAIKY